MTVDMVQSANAFFLPAVLIDGKGFNSTATTAPENCIFLEHSHTPFILVPKRLLSM